ncbi:tetratricopeptide repeat protein [Longispora sp. K20-0274]|uniref:trypsin-like peptidase domain-containing protein n=1 Tax=Longispora sp. K20-0274 TaxID=3088255 RepID=UPI00399C1A7C
MDVFDLARDSTVRIEASSPQRMSTGTGFLVADRQVLTCGHVVADADDISVFWRGNLHKATVETLIPKDAGSRRLYALPDLALLRLQDDLEHDTVWLGPDPPARGAAVAGLGFTSRNAPRALNAGDSPALLEEVRLTVAGHTEGAWRVADDVLASGMSGGPVVDLATGRVVGMMKAKITDEDRKHLGGGWIVGVDEIARALPLLIEQNDVAHSHKSMWWQIASQRQDLQREAFGATVRPLVDLAAEKRPSWWLDPRHHVVPYRPPKEFATLVEWCERTDPGCPSVQLLSAPGGTGKTRLSLELAEKLSEGLWIAGVVPNDHTLKQFVKTLPRLIEARHRVFAAIDYAETSIDDVQRVMMILETLRPANVRVLLVARGGGYWWENLAPNTAAGDLLAAEPVTITDLGADDPAEVASDALEAFWQRIRGSHSTPPDTIREALACQVPGHRRALDLHATALAHVLGGDDDASPHANPLEIVLRHERIYFKRATNQAGVNFAPNNRNSDLVLALPTLLPAETREAALNAANILHEVIEDLPAHPNAIAGILADLYPSETNAFWSPLIPDRLGELLIGQLLQAEHEAGAHLNRIGSLLERADPGQARHVLTVLARVIGYTDGTATATGADAARALLRELLRRRADVFAPEVVSLAATLNDARVFIEDVREDLLAAELETLNSIVIRLPRFRADMVKLAADLELRRVEECRKLVNSAHIPANLSALSDASYNRAIRVGTLGDRSGALEAATEAVAVYSQMPQEALVDRDLEFATLLNNLADRLSTVGRYDEALSAAEAATDLLRGLAGVRPGDHLIHLAASLNNLGNHLASVGRLTEALEAAEESAAIHCESAAEGQPAAMPLLALSLNNLGGLLAEVGRVEDAAEVLAAAAEFCSAQASESPQVWIPDLARTQVNLSITLAATGAHDEALVEADQAAQLWKAMRTREPEAWDPDCASALENLSRRLAACGLTAQALDEAQSAVAIRRAVASASPDSWTQELVISLANLSTRQAECHQPEAALATSTNAVDLARRLAARQPTFQLDLLATLLTNHSCRQAALGNFALAVRATGEALMLYNQTADVGRSATRAGRRASIVALHSEHLQRSGNATDAYPYICRAVDVGRELTTADPTRWTAQLTRWLTSQGSQELNAGKFAKAAATLKEIEVLLHDIVETADDTQFRHAGG